jgi:uracil-DNA glycosylase
MAKKKSAMNETPDLFAATEELPDFKLPDLPPSWTKVLADEFAKPYFAKLMAFVAAERAAHQVFPPEEDVFNAFQFTPYDRVRVLLLGQDPYHDDGQAHGLCFSVKPGVAPPPSLKNMLRELHDDLGCKIPNNGYLAPWAKQGVMLLNTVLTVRAHKAASHKDQGWEHFTDAVIQKINEKDESVVFVLWGAHARKKVRLITNPIHVVIESGHPSPLSATTFFGTRPYSKINAALQKNGFPEINWQLPDV